jgi:hypothetical protein
VTFVNFNDEHSDADLEALLTPASQRDREARYFPDDD